MRFIGHRGASSVAPENTLSAFAHCLDRHVGVECDLQLLRDGEVVILHDDTLERTAQKEMGVEYKALIREQITRLRWVDIKNVDVGSYFAGETFAHDRVPTFAELLRMVRRADAPGGGAHVFAELKGARPHDPKLPEAAAAVAAAENVPAHALTWISFNLPLLVEMKRLCPQYACYYIANPSTHEAAWRAAMASVGAKLDGIDLRADPELVSKELCDFMHERDKHVAVWVGRGVPERGIQAKEDYGANWAALEANGVDACTSNMPPEVWEWQAQRQRDADVTLASKALASLSGAFGASLALCRGDWRRAEDVVDLGHSMMATAVSAQAWSLQTQPYAAAQLEWYSGGGGGAGRNGGGSGGGAGGAAGGMSEEDVQRRHNLVAAPILPPDLDHLTRRFLVCSTTYFAADVVHILSSVLLLGKRPHQWRGRLAHHVIQFAANAPALFSSPPTSAIVRRYLILAYAAELSTIVLRCRSLLAAGGSGSGSGSGGRGGGGRGGRLYTILTRLLLVSFAASRLVNFPLNMRHIYQARHSLPPNVFRLHMVFAAFGIGLSAGWFATLTSQAFGGAGSGTGPRRLANKAAAR